jgi:hypothetical protein
MTEEELERSVQNKYVAMGYKDALENILKIHAFNHVDICKFVRLQDKDKYTITYGLLRLKKGADGQESLLMCNDYKQLLYDYIKRIDFNIFPFKYFQFGFFGDVDIGVILKDSREDGQIQQSYKKAIEETILRYKRKCYIRELKTDDTVLHKSDISILNTQFFYSNFN